MNSKTSSPAKKRMSTLYLCTIAMAIVINYVGGQIALWLHLPIYLDSIGTILTASLLGPVPGMLPPLLSGILMAFTGDIYSLYFAPVGMILGLFTGLVMRRGHHRGARILLDALLITLPGTLVSSLINAALFGGVTSSGSTVLVQLLSHTPLGLTASIFLVQVLTDYLDRLISLALVQTITRVPGFRRLFPEKEVQNS